MFRVKIYRFQWYKDYAPNAYSKRLFSGIDSRQVCGDYARHVLKALDIEGRVKVNKKPYVTILVDTEEKKRKIVKYIHDKWSYSR